MENLKVGTQQLAAYTYGTGNGQLTKQTYGNEDWVSFTYDNLGRVKTATYSEGRKLTYRYTGDGQLYSVHDNKTGYTYQYSYDSLGRLMSSSVKNSSGNVLTTRQTYDANNQLTAQSWQMGSTAYSETYTYSLTTGLLATHTPAVGSQQTFGYDALQRLKTISAGVYTKTYNYKNISDTRTTTQVSSLVYSGNVSQTYSYTYDALGNILTYTAPGKAAFTYTYDNQGQLTKATNGTTTYNYSYDTVGNITAANGHSYTYGNSNWRDLLTAYDGQSISYDGSGNPTSYYNGTRWTMAWEKGRRLISASGGGNSITYAYDSEGLRLSKTVGTTQHNYYYAGGKLMRETYGSNTLDFFYDSTGTPYALKHNGTVYYYVTNLQGDVMNLVDGSGNVVATYDYDPYGKVITATGTMAAVNPLRYRGYYYDTESGLYYLQSRYYDPTIGRFINSDSYASTGQGILGHNMFAYCNNNPCNYYDPYGDALLPFPTIVDYYVMHQIVQMLVVMEYGFAMEVYISSPYGFGRMDLFDAENNQYYEVKHAPQHQQFMSSHQKMKYDNARVIGIMLKGYSFSGPPTPGTRTDISGSFQYQYWDVTYQSHGDGVITYEWALNEQRYNQHVGTIATVAGAAALSAAYGQRGGNHKYQFAKDFWY